MKVTVTIADAEKAREAGGFRSDHCPLAQALRRAGFHRVEVYGTFAFDDERNRKLTPEATHFAHLADATGDDPLALGLPREIEVWSDEPVEDAI